MVSDDDADGLLKAVLQARAGKLAGHVPVKGERYSCRLFFHKSGSIIVKLTRKPAPERREHTE
jgi:hypothetical protein